MRRSILCVAAVLLAATGSRAGLLSSADMKVSAADPASGFTYHYDIMLHDTGDTTIGTLWYAWDDSNIDFMSSEPGNISGPLGWYAYETPGYNYDPNSGGYSYTYGIEWYSYLSLYNLNAGGTMAGFGFDSNESPAELSGTSDVTPTFPVGTSFAYIGTPEGDAGFQFVVAPSLVPEPSGLAYLGIAGTLIARRRQVR